MKLITFKREISISDILLLVGVGFIMSTDHYRIGRLEEDTKTMAASIARTDANLSSLAASCHETAGTVAQLAKLLDNRVTPVSPVRY